MYSLGSPTDQRKPWRAILSNRYALLQVLVTVHHLLYRQLPPSQSNKHRLMPYSQCSTLINPLNLLYPAPPRPQNQPQRSKCPLLRGLPFGRFSFSTKNRKISLRQFCGCRTYATLVSRFTCMLTFFNAVG